MVGQAATRPVNILVVSDEVDRLLYSNQIRERFVPGAFRAFLAICLRSYRGRRS